MTGFQTSVQQNQAYGVVGDFATTGPWTTVPAMSGELTAGAAGVTIGQFAWADDVTGVVTNYKPNNASTRFGYVGRAGQRATLTAFLAEASMVINPGYEVTLYDGGAYFDKAPAGGATIGQKLFAPYAGGAPVLGTAGTAPTVATTTVSTTNGSPNLTAVSAPLYPGQPISGTGIPANTTVVSYNSTNNTAVMSANATATGTGVTLTQTTAYETRFYVKTAGAAGDIYIFSDRGF